MADLKGRQNNASELRNREALIITGINRYIVGCKSTGTDSNKSLAAGINRYIVGCKYIWNIGDIMGRFELIDT